VHSGLTYGLTEVRGTHDWRNSVVAGAATGAAVALTLDRPSHEQVVQGAIVGATLSTAANVLTGVFASALLARASARRDALRRFQG
jgi:hypothetical protein